MRSLYCILLLFAAVTSSFASFVFDLNSDTFGHYLQDKDVMLVDFFAPWCGHCKNLAPEMENAANTLATKNQFVFAKVDCIQPQNEALCKKFNIQGYPSLKLFKFGQYSGDYIGGRTSNDLLTYMDSVTEASAQRAPLTANGPSSFAASLGASPQGYVNPLQFQQPPHPQLYQVPLPGQAAPSFFSGHLTAPALGQGPSLVHSFYGASQPANQPAVAPFSNQHKVEAKAPNFNVGPTRNSAAGKFGGNMLALEILRAKLKMIAAYKNWQKRLKEYKEKMSDAAKMNLNKGFAKHNIRKPANPAAVLKAKAYLRKTKSAVNRFQKKFPRTFPAPVYRPKTPYRPYGPAAAAARRGSIYGRPEYQPQRAAYQRPMPYRQPYSASYKRYFAFKQQQRQRLQQAQQRRQQIQQQQQRQQRQRMQQAQQRQQIPQQQQQQRQQQLQGYQRPYSRSFIARPQEAQEVSEAALRQEESQADKASYIQAKPKETSDVVAQPKTQAQETTGQPEGQVTNDAQDKTKPPASDSMKDLKQDIEKAIKDALKPKDNNKVANTKTVAKAGETAGTKSLDVAGSGSGQEGQASGSGGEQHADHADVSGSGSGGKPAVSGSGSGESASTKSDKASGEA